MDRTFSKIWIIIVIIVLVAGGILAWQYFGVPKKKAKVSKTKVMEEKIPEEKITKNKIAKPVPSEVEGWKTYRNEKYGFEVKYPSTFVEIEPKEMGFEKITSGGEVGFLHIYKKEVPSIYYEIIVAPEERKGSLEEWKKSFGGSFTEIIKIGGKEGVKAVSKKGRQTMVVVENQGKIYMISFETYPEFEKYSDEFKNETYNTYLKYFNQMLSTFRFIEMDKNADFSSLNKDEMLHKLFPKLTFANGVANHTAEYPEYLNLHLQNSIEDYFINPYEKNLLLVAKLDGVGHAGGLYHAYLGLFDKNGNLLTPTSSYPASIGDSANNGANAQFGGDQGNFGFYDCNGVKYIAFASAGCPNGSCCFGKVELFRINKGEFEKIQTIDENSLTKSPSYGLKMILSGEKIIIKKVPSISENGCPETDFKEMK